MQEANSSVRLARQNRMNPQTDPGRSETISPETDMSEQAEQAALEQPARQHPVMKGAMIGALAGFAMGLVPLLASTLIAAGAGALIAKATEFRVEGSAPRIRFDRRRR
jgi:predicted lipid-binding transport protein (Tim44 family)